MAAISQTKGTSRSGDNVCVQAARIKNLSATGTS